MVFLSTAHPCKFPEVFPSDIRAGIEVPAQVEDLAKRKTAVTEMDNCFNALKEYLINQF